MDVSIRAELPAVRDQGTRPTCLAFALTAAHGLLRPPPAYLELSEEMLHQNAKTIGRHSDAITLTSAENALASVGQCLLSLCPYEALEAVLPLSHDAMVDASERKATLNVQGTGFQSVKQLVLARIPAVLILELYPSFFGVQDGDVPVPSVGEVLQGRHAVVATGLVTRNGEEVIEFRNSWSDGWGDGGYGYLLPAYLDNFCTDVRVLKAVPSTS